MKQIFKKLGKHIFWGLLLILGGLFLYIITIWTIGYIPFTDNRSFGWQEEKLSISYDDINHIWQFIRLLAIYVFVELIIVYGIFSLFKLIGYNRLIYAVLGGIIIGLLTFYSALRTGWEIEVDISSIIAGGVFGFIYGTTLFPKYLKPRTTKKIKPTI